MEAAVRKEPAPSGLSRGRIRLLPSEDIAIEILPFVLLGRSAGSRWPGPRSIPATSFLCHKTTRRDVYTRAQAGRPDVDDVILWNTKGEITEATIANVIVEIGGQRWTPAADLRASCPASPAAASSMKGSSASARSPWPS